MRNRRSALRSSAPSAFTNSFEPSRPTPKYGVEPRASRLACSSWASGTPTSARPSAMARPGGRRSGPPNTTTAMAPASQPTSTAPAVSNPTADVMNRSTANPITSTHARRRQSRLSHGAAAVTAAAIAPSTGTVGNVESVRNPSPSWSSTGVPFDGPKCWRMAASAAPRRAADPTVRKSRHPPLHHHEQSYRQQHDGEDARPRPR